MINRPLDYLIIGPAHPFRGGIAETQHELGKALIALGKNVTLLTFTSLYPNRFFPGKTQKSKQPEPKSLHRIEELHAYNPLKWNKTIKAIISLQPKVVVFRYYTPFLAPAYGTIAKKLPKSIKKIALVDNWIPHESSFFDTLLNHYFGAQIEAFTTLSDTVGNQIEKVFKVPVWKGFHPIATDLLPPLSKKVARKLLGWDNSKKVVLFFGLIRKYKGLELLIQSFAEPAIQGENVFLHVAGECYEKEKKYIDLVHSLEIEKKVHFDFKFQDKKSIQLLFSAADVVAQTYHSATQSGITPLAYYYQKPLLVSDINGLKNPILQDESGTCVSKKPSEIAKNLVRIMEPKIASFHQKKIIEALPKYSWESYAKAWDHFITKV
jgi:glycosyltransferase involved in cell wall biosynthesis